MKIDRRKIPQHLRHLTNKQLDLLIQLYKARL